LAGNSSATISITPLADIPDYYMLWVAGDPDKTCTVTPPETSCVIEGLTNGESYTFLAAAGNAAGYSAASAESLETTPDINAGMLPYTGNNTRGLTSVALTLIGLGGAVTALARRRRSTVA
jgi:LPXTG-motif cell wall-anchored protein